MKKIKNNMTTLEKIKRAVEESRQFPNPKIEYNFKELPSGVDEDNFFGVIAFYNDKMAKETAKVIYKLS